MAGANIPPSSSVAMKDDTVRRNRGFIPYTSTLPKFEQDVHIVDGINAISDGNDGLTQSTVLKVSAEKTPPPDPSSIPFVLDEGQTSFWTPSVCSSDSISSTSPPESSRLFSVSSSGSSRFSNYAAPCALEEISIWRNLNGTKQVCAQSVGGTILDSVSLQSLDPSFSRYGIIHDAVARAECPSIRVQVPVVPRQSDGNLEDIESVISILVNGDTSVRSLAEIYRQGVLYSSCELSLKQEGSKSTDGTLFSAKLPQDFLRVFRGEGGPDNAMDVLLLQFIQKSSGAEQDRYHDTLIVLCELRPEADASETGIKVSLLWSGFSPGQDRRLPESGSSSARSSDEEHSSPSSPGRSQHRRGAPRATPKLSVAIPPAVRNVVHIYSESPASGFPSSLLPTSSISHSNPLPEIPQSPLPMTPQDQSLNSPAEPSQISATRATFMSAPREGLYPFTLSTSSPGAVLSPAFGVLDPGSISPAGGSAPAWNTLGTPFTPSFFQQFPRSAMHPMTRTSVFPGSPDEGNDNRLLVPHLSYPDSPSVYSCASYRSPI